VGDSSKIVVVAMEMNTNLSTTASNATTAMSMGGGDSNACKISVSISDASETRVPLARSAARCLFHNADGSVEMLWNWYTIDSCFLARGWHVRSEAVFAGTCIGVFALVLLLESSRRAVKEYDRILVRRRIKKMQLDEEASVGLGVTTETIIEDPRSPLLFEDVAKQLQLSHTLKRNQTKDEAPPYLKDLYRPNLLEQAIRALLRTVQFALAYVVML
jgi:Ctr copper transporter family